MASPPYYYTGGHKYWLYGSYSDKQKAYSVGKMLKARYGGKYFVMATDAWYGAYPLYHVYATKVRKVWS